MTAALVRFVLSQRLITMLAALVMIATGVWCYTQLRLEAYPDISDPQVVVIAQFPGRAAEEVEQQVTLPIERALNSVPNVIGRRSRTIFGLAVVELTFLDTVDDYFARQMVLEKLRDASLPDGVTPALGPLSTGIGELYRYRLVTSDTKGTPEEREMKLRELHDWVVAPRLLQVQGVADVTIFGGLVKQFRIEVNPQALEKHNITVTQIANAVSANNRNAGGAQVDNFEQQLVVRGEGLIREVKDIENIIVENQNGIAIFVKDVATVKVHAAPRTGVLGVNKDQGGTEGIVLMRRWENPSDVLDRIHEAVRDLNENKRLPEGVKLETLYDRTDLVENSLHTVAHTLIEALIIVVVVLLVFLGNARAAFLAAVTIPLALLFAFIGMYMFGIPLNLLSLGALDFGVVVDGTVVLVEHLMGTLTGGHGALTVSPLVAIQEAALEVERPIFFSMLIIVAAYIPLFTLQRTERRLFTPMAYTVCIALVGALVIALSVVPVLATFFFAKGASHWENPILTQVYNLYSAVVRWTLRIPRMVLFTCGAIVVAAMILGSRIGTEFLPQLDEGVIWIRVSLEPGISLKRSSDIAAQIRDIIKKHEEIEVAVSQTGRNDSGTDPFGPNRNEFLVTMKPYSTWKPGRVKADLIEELGKELRGSVTGAKFTFTQPIIDTSMEMATGSSADLAIILRGRDLAELRKLGGDVLGMLSKVPGSVDSAIEQEIDQTQLLIRLNRTQVATFGINVSDVMDVIEMAIGGRAVSTLYEGDRRFDITVKYPHEARGDEKAIGDIQVPTKDGGRIPLSRLAKIEFPPGASIIARGENLRQITVRTNIRGRDQGSFVDDAKERLEKQVKVPAGVDVVWGGMFENLERARKRLTFIMPVTIGVIFGLLFWTFGSAADAAMVLCNVPFSMVGGIVALWWRGMNFSVSAAVGFISLFGVAVMSGVLYISDINRRRQKPGTTVYQAILEGATTQFRPRLMLILVALMGLVPAARATGIGSDVQRPLATVVVGGLISTLFLTLLGLPSLYAVFAGAKAPSASEPPPEPAPHGHDAPPAHDAGPAAPKAH